MVGAESIGRGLGLKQLICVLRIEQLRGSDTEYRAEHGIRSGSRLNYVSERKKPMPTDDFDFNYISIRSFTSYACEVGEGTLEKEISFHVAAGPSTERRGDGFPVYGVPDVSQQTRSISSC